MQTQLIAGYTKEQMVLYFFEQHQHGEYSSYFITNYIYNTFELPEEKTIEQLSREVCATLANFIYGKSTNKPNMNRKGIRHFFLYYFSGTSNTNLPQESYVIKSKNKRKLKISPTQQSFEEEIKEEKPIQTSFDFESLKIEDPEEEINQEPIEEISNEDIFPQLMQDIQNADYINEYFTDPLKYIMDQVDRLGFSNVKEMVFKSIINNKEITITVTDI
jgi:hypothetical protein